MTEWPRLKQTNWTIGGTIIWPFYLLLSLFSDQIFQRWNKCPLVAKPSFSFLALPPIFSLSFFFFAVADAVEKVQTSEGHGTQCCTCFTADLLRVVLFYGLKNDCFSTTFNPLLCYCSSPGNCCARMKWARWPDITLPSVRWGFTL